MSLTAAPVWQNWWIRAVFWGQLCGFPTSDQQERKKGREEGEKKKRSPRAKIRTATKSCCKVSAEDALNLLRRRRNERESLPAPAILIRPSLKYSHIWTWGPPHPPLPCASAPHKPEKIEPRCKWIINYQSSSLGVCALHWPPLLLGDVLLLSRLHQPFLSVTFSHANQPPHLCSLESAGDFSCRLRELTLGLSCRWIDFQCEGCLLKI